MKIKNRQKEQTRMPGSDRLDYFTGLKGIACLMVSMNHFIGAFMNANEWKAKWYCLFYNGSYMVNVFIMLSCFFMAYSFFRNHSGEKVSKYVFTRYFRLTVPILAVLLLICLLQHMDAYQYWDRILPLTDSQRKEADALNYYSVYSLKETVVTAMTCLFAGTTKLTFTLWMLPLLFKANMYTVLICFAVDRCRTPYKVITLAAAYYLVSLYCGYTIAVCVPAVFLAWLYNDYFAASNGSRKNNENRLMWIGGGMLLIAAWIGTYWPGMPADRFRPFALLKNDYNFWYNIGALAMGMAMLMLEPLQKLLEKKPVVFLGEISFGYYLLHDPVQATLGTWMYYLFYQMCGQQKIAVMAALVSFLPVTIILSFLFYKYVDRYIQIKINALYRRICGETC